MNDMLTVTDEDETREEDELANLAVPSREGPLLTPEAKRAVVTVLTVTSSSSTPIAGGHQ